MKNSILGAIAFVAMAAEIIGGWNMFEGNVVGTVVFFVSCAYLLLFAYANNRKRS